MVVLLPIILLAVIVFLVMLLANRLASIERKLLVYENELWLLRKQVSEMAQRNSADHAEAAAAPASPASAPLQVDAPPYISSPGYIPPKGEVVPPLPDDLPSVPPVFLTIDVDELIPVPESTATEPEFPPLISADSVTAVPQQQCNPEDFRQPASKKVDWEIMIGGNLFTFLGAIVIVIAMGLLLTFAYDQGWIRPSPIMRVLTGILLGVGFMLLGARMKAVGLAVFAQGLVGAGIAILFLVVYAAYSFYHLPYFSLPLLMAAMLLITLLALWQSLRYDSQAIALLGLLGGVLAPIIIGGGDNSRDSTPVVSYYIYITFLLLELSIMQLIRRNWLVLSFAALGSGYLLFLLPYYSRFPNSWIPLAFLLLYWLVFQLTELCQGIRACDDGALERSWRTNINHLLFILISYFSYKNWHLELMNEFFLLCALLPFIFSLLAARFVDLRSMLTAGYLRATIAFLSIGLYFSFTHFPVVIIWSFIAGTLVMLGLKMRLSVLWKSALLLFSAGIILFLFTSGAFVYQKIHYLPIINMRSLAMLALIFALGLSSWRFMREEEESDALWIAPLLQYLALLLGAMLLVIETLAIHFTVTGGSEALFQSSNEMMAAVILVVYSLPLLWHGLRMASAPHQHVGLLALLAGVWLAAYFGYEYEPMEGYRLLFNLRALPMIIAASALLLQAKLFKRERERYYTADLITGLMQVLAALLFFELITVETTAFFYAAQLNGSFLGGFVRSTCMPMLWAGYAILLGWYAYHRRYQALQVTTLVVLLLSLIFIAYALFNEIEISTFSAAVPVRIIPALLVFSAMLLHLKYLTAFRQINWAATVRTALILFTSAFGFMIINVECSGYFYRMSAAAVGENISAILYARNLTFAACWAIYACCWSWIGLRRNNGLVTIIGITTLMLAIAWAAIQSLAEYRFNYFTLLLNWRGATLLVVIAAVAAHSWLLHRYRHYHHSYALLVAILRIICVILIFELLTVETIEYFTHRIMQVGYSTPAAAHFIELRRTAISVVWLLYSVALIVIGIWRSWREIRLIAIALFLLSILQIALYYLMIPNLLYRIISLTGLGITLLFTSYLYHRYRAIILAPPVKHQVDEEVRLTADEEKVDENPAAE